MEPELRDLLRNVATDPIGDSYTHVTSYGPLSRWTIRPHSLAAFWIGLCNLVEAKTNGKDGVPPEPLANLCLAERPQPVMPLIAEFTFKFHAGAAEEDSWEPYDDEFLHWIAHTYQCVLDEYFRLPSPTKMELVAAVSESQTHWYEDDKERNQRFLVTQIKIQFPYSRIDTGLQNRLIRPRVIQLLRNNNVMAKMQRQPVGDWEQIISSTVINNPVIMYGNSEVQGRPKLLLSHLWSVVDREMLETSMQPLEITIQDAFIVDNHAHLQQQIVNRAIFQDVKDSKYLLPIFLSMGYWTTIIVPKDDTNDGGRFTTQLRVMNTQPEQPRVFNAGKTHENNDESDMELAERMIPLINNSRYLREAYWMDVGKALYVSGDGSENGLLSWIRHTERAMAGIQNIPAYMLVADNIEDTCRNLYYTFANSPITVKTLAWYAREDSPERYANWHREWCMSSMETALSGYHTDVCVALHRVYWLDFVYCPVGKGKWFQFRNHRWYEMNQGINLRKCISQDFMKRFESTRMILSQQIHDSGDETFRTNGETTMKRLTYIIGKLKTVGFKSSIMQEACEHFSQDRFVSLLDTAAELTGVTNGILEAAGAHILFRPAKPEDYISMCANIPYHANFTWKHPLVIECMKWLGQVFTDRSLLHHFLKFAASCLKGRNSDKIFPIWTGAGDNSKSMIVKLFEASFASYCIKFPVSMLSEKAMNSSGPTPQLARAKATRLAFLDEPEDDIPIHKGTIKRYTGGDSFFARLLQDNGGDVQATFKMVLMCNKVPIIPNADKAIKNRTRLFPFMSTWEDNPPEDETEQYRQRRFRKNVNFERRIPIMAPAFLWIMAEYYPYYSTEGLTDPQIVTETTAAYWRDNDVYAQFAADTIHEVYNDAGERDAGSRVTLTEVYTAFKLWFRDSFPGTKPPERTIVRTELSSRWGRMQGNAWHGIVIIGDGNSAVDMTANLGGRKKPIDKPVIIAETANVNQRVQAIPKEIQQPQTFNLPITKPKSPKPIVSDIKIITPPTTPKQLGIHHTTILI